MDELNLVAWPYLIPIVAIIGAFAAAIVSSMNRARIRELEIRERIAMIERGMMPSPESDPTEFERRMRAVDRVQRGYGGAARFRSGGVMVIFVGFGLMTLLWFVDVPREAIGVGGLVVMIGLGLLVNSMFASSSYQPPPIQSVPPPTSGNGPMTTSGPPKSQS